jgi:prepilin-type N-terminal cleavage/methylation domain-containing protein
MNHPQRTEAADRGFTLLELLVVLALISMIVLVGYPALNKMINRNRLLGVATEATNGLRLARYQAIKNSRPTVYSIDPDTREILSWVDDDDDGELDAGEQVLMRTTLQAGLYIGKPPAADGDPIDGFDGTTMARFNPDGSVDSVGAYRLCDHPDNPRNFLEVGVRPRSVARVEIKKWDGAYWWGRDEGLNPWVWK